jgi:exonuclease III
MYSKALALDEHTQCCWTWNANGIRDKVYLLQETILRATTAPEVILISETHLAENESPPTIPGYRCLHNGKSSRSQGVAIYTVASKQVNKFNLPHSNSRMIAAEMEDAVYMAAYAPVDSAPNEKRERFYQRLLENIEAMIASGHSYVIGGDFNAHLATPLYRNGKLL